MVAPSSRFGIAGLVVRTHPVDLPTVLARLGALPGVDIHHRDPEGGRAVVTLEVTSPERGEDQLRAMREVPGVLTAELVFHYRDQGAV